MKKLLVGMIVLMMLLQGFARSLRQIQIRYGKRTLGIQFHDGILG